LAEAYVTPLKPPKGCDSAHYDKSTIGFRRSSRTHARRRWTSPFHGENTGSIPVGRANGINNLRAIFERTSPRYGNYTENPSPNSGELWRSIPCFEFRPLHRLTARSTGWRARMDSAPTNDALRPYDRRMVENNSFVPGTGPRGKIEGRSVAFTVWHINFFKIFPILRQRFATGESTRAFLRGTTSASARFRGSP
jgi:hypothetical protein